MTGSNVESHLRELGFGYRAKYIAQTAKSIAAAGPAASWLASLRNAKNPSWGAKAQASDGTPATYKDAHEQLLTLSGVGPKVADCVCLMGLGWAEAVPVDTHVWQIAQRDYKFGKVKTKTFNKVLYDAVGDHFRELWGDEAGWAHSVLFTADLKTFSDQAAAKPEAADAVVEIKKEKTEILQISTSDSSRKRRRAVSSIVIEEKVEVKRNRTRSRK